MKRAIESRPSIGTVARVVVRRSISLPQVVFSSPTIMIVRRGVVELARGGRRCTASDNQVIVLPAGMAFDIDYRPCDEAGFMADWLSPDPVAIGNDVSREEMDDAEWLPLPINAVDAAFRDSVRRSIEAIKKPTSLSESIALQHMREVVRWIEVKGGVVCAARANSVAHRVWSILATDPARDWRPIDVSANIGVAVHRLRGLLAEDGTTFVRQLCDVQMGHVLSEILVTNRPIYAIAEDIGHRSAAQFRTRFFKRYGVLPGDVRGYRRSIRARPMSAERSTTPALIVRATHSADGSARSDVLKRTPA